MSIMLSSYLLNSLTFSFPHSFSFFVILTLYSLKATCQVNCLIIIKQLLFCRDFLGLTLQVFELDKIDLHDNEYRIWTK